ncbi:hypothetical protein [Nocardia aurea]|uniref:hypothetical protein n=1 Tax=Nocardia aurea TaxID=2144174 RepID=UPI0033A191CC
MRLGLIARADSRGLGIQTFQFSRHMDCAKIMVVDCPSANPLPLRRDWYPDATWIKGLPTVQDYAHFLDGLDVVYTAECDYSRDGTLYRLADAMGVKTALHLNYEFFEHGRNPNLPRPSLFAAPSMWHYDEIPDPKTFLAVPIDLDQFPARPRMSEAARFLHIIGRPAINDRNGTADLLDALAFVRSPITLTITCQDAHYVSGLLASRRIPRHITLEVRTGDAEHYADLYANQDVLILPRRFGGLCLPANEGLGAGMPVVMPDISPNNTWLPADWLVPAERRGEFMAKTRVALHSTATQALAEKIDQFVEDRAFFAASQDTAQRIAKELSWANQRPVYMKTFSDLCKGPESRTPSSATSSV